MYSFSLLTKLKIHCVSRLKYNLSMSRNLNLRTYGRVLSHCIEIVLSTLKVTIVMLYCWHSTAVRGKGHVCWQAGGKRIYLDSVQLKAVNRKIYPYIINSEWAGDKNRFHDSQMIFFMWRGGEQEVYWALII